MKTTLLIVCFLSTAALATSSSDVERKANNLMKSITDSTNRMVGVVNKFQNVIITPAINDLEHRIREINLNIEGLSQSEKNIVKGSLNKLVSSRNELKSIQSVLKTLANDTISRSNRLKSTINNIRPNQRNVVSHITDAAEKLIDIMKQSQQKLDSSRRKYYSIQRNISGVQADLETFNQKLHSLIDESSSRYKSWVSKTRKAVYGGGAACAIFPPSCAIYYATAAGVLETKIKDYKKAVNRQRDACNRAMSVTNDSLRQVKSVDDQLSSEIHNIIQWESSLAEMKMDFASVGDVAFLVDIDNVGAIQMLNRLIQACQNYVRSH